MCFVVAVVVVVRCCCCYCRRRRRCCCFPQGVVIIVGFFFWVVWFVCLFVFVCFVLFQCFVLFWFLFCFGFLVMPQLLSTCLKVRTELSLLWSEGKRHSKPVVLWFLQGRHRPHSWVNWGQSVQMGLTRTSTDRQETSSTRTTTPCLADNVVRGPRRGPGFTAFKHYTEKTYSSHSGPFTR